MVTSAILGRGAHRVSCFAILRDGTVPSIKSIPWIMKIEKKMFGWKNKTKREEKFEPSIHL
jgi:hypothetical protein